MTQIKQYNAVSLRTKLVQQKGGYWKTSESYKL